MTYIKTYIKKGLNVKCAICSKTFYTWPSYTKRGGGKYCSLECFNNDRPKPDPTPKVHLKENENSELKELSETYLVRNHTKENKFTPSYPIILNPVPENWLYNLRIKEAEKRGRHWFDC